MFQRAVMAIAVLIFAAATAMAQAANSNQAARLGSPAGAWAAARDAIGDPQTWVFGSSSVSIEMLNRSGETDRTILLDQQITEEGDELVLTVTPLSVTSGGGLPTPPGAPGSNSAPIDPNSRMGRMMSQSEGQNGNAQSQVPANPFATAVADSVALSETGESRPIGGVAAQEYGIAWSDPDGSAYSGTIWLNAETGAPIRLDVVGAMAEEDIREFRTTISYEDRDGVTLPARSITRASRRMNLFITIRTRITVSYNDYFETDGTREIVLGELPGQEE